MKRFQRVVATLLLGALTLGLVAGCLHMSTSPVARPEATTTQVARAAQPDGLIGSIVGALVKLIYKVLDIVGSLGGSLTNGRWRVDVPAGAFDGTARVSIGVLTNTSPSCQLDISPADKNHFQKPVRLTVDCSSVPTDVLRNYTILWFNPTTNTWTPVAGSTVDLTRKTVSAPLEHFSSYAVGNKAGW
jgi:hypothetical protein